MLIVLRDTSWAPSPAWGPLSRLSRWGPLSPTLLPETPEAPLLPKTPEPSLPLRPPGPLCVERWLWRSLWGRCVGQRLCVSLFYLPAIQFEATVFHPNSASLNKLTRSLSFFMFSSILSFQFKLFFLYFGNIFTAYRTFFHICLLLLLLKLPWHHLLASSSVKELNLSLASCNYKLERLSFPGFSFFGI